MEMPQALNERTLKNSRGAPLSNYKYATTFTQLKHTKHAITTSHSLYRQTTCSGERTEVD